MTVELKPMHWPKPVPLLWWVGDYADIRDRVQRDGRLDIDEIWEPHSGDSYEAFCGRHGTHMFDYDWMELQQRDRDEIQRQKARQADRVGRLQEQWEAERWQSQRAKQAQGDREWQEAEVARVERLRQARAAQQQIAQGVASASQSRLSEAMMEQWFDLVARKGWSEGEAATRWNDWLTGPPGFFG